MNQNTPSTGRQMPAETTGSAVRKDTVAGFVNAVVSVPDGLASATLAGVNPVYGLYTSIAAPITGSALVSGQLMQISTTSASALAAGQIIAAYPAGERDNALFLLVVLIGVWLAVFGLLRAGRLVRFVSHAVMTGFLAGVAALLILDQSAPFVGIKAEGSNEVAQFLNLLARGSEFSGTTILTGSLALVLAIGLGRTVVGNLSSVVALVVPSLLVVLFNWAGVQRVADVSPIPSGIPVPALPDFALLTPALIAGAFAIAVVIGVQGAGVSQSVENPDDSPVNPSRDLVAQGAANVASGLFSGIPAGGSVGQTALNIAVGARTRWAGILGGVWMLVIVLAARGLVGRVPMTVLAAIMIMSGISALDFREARSIWTTGGSARLGIVVTFVATLFLSIPLAVGAGVLLTIILYLSSSASDITVRALVPLGNGRFAEESPPSRLESHAVIVLDVYGSLFFAGARTLGDALPSADGVRRPAVVLRLRGRSRIGATLIEVLSDYAESLSEADGRLYLAGVSDVVAAQLRRSGKLDIGGVVHILPARPVLGESISEALALADDWLGGPHERPEEG
ncbi:MAG TPA: SulP family inorganic anion transporter [Bryobacteraceae bacterium]|nr:SulP family inorganic anion transporter [Bryobacteraceae bacterium]